MKRLLLIGTVLLLHYTPYAQNSTIEGIWNGEIVSGMGTLDLQLVIKQKGSRLKGHISSNTTGASALQLDSIHFDNKELYFEVRAAQAAYKGSLNDSVLAGTWTQGTYSLPLNFVPHDRYTPSIAVSPREQTPRPPFDYVSKEIEFTNAGEDITLDGTLTLPNGEGPFPAVILLTVAGANDRDETHGKGHKPFMVLADHLTRNGIAVLRWDDRGTGFSEGDLFASSFEDLTDDALSAIEFLQSQEFIDKDNIGIIGHSEGTVIGPMTALKGKDKVAFLVMLGPAGVPLIELTEDRLNVTWEDRGFSEAQKQELLDHMKQVTAILHQKKNDEESYQLIAALKAETTLDDPNFPTQQFMVPKDKDERIKLFISPWYRSQATYHPKDYLPKLDIPVLSITGTLDKVQTPEVNVPPIETYLSEAPVTDFTIEIVPKVNHLMQTAKTGLPTEYPLLNETFSPDVLNLITTWIQARL